MMRTNKPAVIWASITSIAALVVSLILHFTGFEFVSNLFSGIFASGILTVMISIINYRTERIRTLEKFYSYAKKAACNYNRFEKDGSLERSIDSILKMNEFDYIELDNAFGDISFIFNDKKTRAYIYEKLYEPTLTLRSIIEEKCFHFREYRKDFKGNSRVMQNFVDEVANALMVNTGMKSVNEHGVSMVMKISYNKVVEQLYEELNGEYYKIMYPHVKKKEKKDTD